MKTSNFFRIPFLLLLASSAFASVPAQGPVSDPLSNLIQPDVILGHQKEIGLTDSQRDALIKEMQKGQTATIEPSVKMRLAAEDLNDVLGKSHVDEDKAIKSLLNLTKQENEVKTAMVRYLVRVKNILTPGQQDKLSGKSDSSLNGVKSAN